MPSAGAPLLPLSLPPLFSSGTAMWLGQLCSAGWLLACLPACPSQADWMVGWFNDKSSSSVENGVQVKGTLSNLQTHFWTSGPASRVHPSHRPSPGGLQHPSRGCPDQWAAHQCGETASGGSAILRYTRFTSAQPLNRVNLLRHGIGSFGFKVRVHCRRKV